MLGSDRRTITLPCEARVAVVVALGLFVLAAGAALLTTVPRDYQRVAAKTLRGVIDNRWDDLDYKAEKKVARTRVTVLEAAQKANDSKAKSLLWAMGFEIAASGALGVAAGLILAAN